MTNTETRQWIRYETAGIYNAYAVSGSNCHAQLLWKGQAYKHQEFTNFEDAQEQARVWLLAEGDAITNTVTGQYDA